MFQFIIEIEEPKVHVAIMYDTSDSSFWLKVDDGLCESRGDVTAVLTFLKAYFGDEWLRAYTPWNDIVISKNLLTQELLTLAQITAGSYVLKSL